MEIRLARLSDHEAIWSVIEPVIRGGETYALPRDMERDEALAYWTASDRETFVAEIDGTVVGTYFIHPNQLGGGSHVANCGYVTCQRARGRGVARAMAEHSLVHARARGYRAMQFNFVISTNHRAIRLWQSLGFEALCRLPDAFQHPTEGFVDALVMFRPL